MTLQSLNCADRADNYGTACKPKTYTNVAYTICRYTRYELWAAVIVAEHIMLLGKLLIETSFSRTPNRVKRCARLLQTSILYRLNFAIDSDSFSDEPFSTLCGCMPDSEHVF